MIAARSMATLTPHIPLRHILRVYVVIDRMATVAERAFGPLHVVSRIQRAPPTASFRGHHIGKPSASSDVPLHRQREIVIADPREKPLLPKVAVDEGNLIDGELRHCVGREVGKDRIGIRPWIAHHVCHRRVLPAVIDGRMALLAGL